MSRSNYLDFGGVPAAATLNRSGTLSYLQSLGFGDGDLHQARHALDNQIELNFTFDAVGVNYCDFCLDRIMGGEYEKLRDGRDRCSKCSRIVLSTHEQFVDEYHRVRRNMEMAFGITLETVMTVKMVNAREIAKGTGEFFTPSPGIDSRVLGYATKTNEGHALYIENGSPRMAAISTMAHELTHIWQFTNWNQAEIEKKYGKKNMLLVHEGMAMWAQIQYLLFIREKETAQREFAYTLQRDDAYGHGLRIFVERHPLSITGEVGEDSPFHQMFPL